MQSGPRISYTVPREGSFPVPAKVTVGAEHYSLFEDKAKNPVQMRRVEGQREPVIENCDGAWGFNGQIQSGANDDKFDVSGNAAMIISFKLYLKRMGTEDQGHVFTGANVVWVAVPFYTSRGQLEKLHNDELFYQRAESMV